MQRYVKPASLTWWASVVPLICGVILATEHMHGQAALVEAIRNATGMTAPALINLGIAGIGLRGAMD